MTTVPVRDKDGAIVLYDIFVAGEWIGSRRTLAHCQESYRNHVGGHANADRQQ